MKKIDIITKKQELINYISKMVICNVPKKSQHCKNNCFHGVPHEKEKERDGCHVPAFCNMGGSGLIKVHCKPLTKKAQKEWVEKELNK